jgi:hypothetical protein
MSDCSLTPSPPPACLERSYLSRKIKGGTVIAEDVLDLDTHRDKLADPDTYRAIIPPQRHCGGKLHALCYRHRHLRMARGEETSQQTVPVRLFRCSRESCRAVFMVLPAFIARHLWRRWSTVESVCTGKLQAPKTTAKRWLGRLGSSATLLVQIFLAQASSLLPPALHSTLAKAAMRFAVVAAFQGAFADQAERSYTLVAAWIHRLQPGIRLM